MSDDSRPWTKNTEGGTNVGLPDPERSRFAPSEADAWQMFGSATERAERLAGRIVAAQAAIRKGAPMAAVYAILGGGRWRS